MIPVCEPNLKGKELEYVTDCMKKGDISSQGEYVPKFEQAFAEFCECKHGIGCANGTVALHLALKALGIGKGDEVIVPTFTMIATANAVKYCGAIPIFVDSELSTWNMRVDEELENAITDKTKAIIVVHTYGLPVDMDKVNDLAKKYSLYVIEDAAEAHGATYKGKKVGSLGDVACFSFYANKIITTGEGGMVVTNNDKIAERCRSLRNHCFTKPRFIHYEVGFNYRMTNIQAAIGLGQLERVNELIKEKIRVGATYDKYLSTLSYIERPPKVDYATNVYWMYGIRTMIFDKEELMKELERQGVETRSFFYPMHKQPCFKKDKETMLQSYKHMPASEMLYDTGLYLPSSTLLTEEQIRYICDKIKVITWKKGQE